MFNKIEIEKADNGYILYVDRGVNKIGGFPPQPKVFSSERALIKELRLLLKEQMPLTIIEGAKK